MAGPWSGYDPPEGVSGWSDWHWWKVPGGRILQLIILSDGPLGYSGHYCHDRMEPCYGKECAECQKGTGAQLRYMFGAVEPTGRRVGIWDVSRSIALQIRDLGDQRGKLRGLWLAIGHVSSSKHSQTTFEVVDKEVPIWLVETVEPDRQRALVETWRHRGLAIPDGYDKKVDTETKAEKFRKRIPKSLA